MYYKDSTEKKAQMEQIQEPSLCPHIPARLLREGEQSCGTRDHLFINMNENQCWTKYEIFVIFTWSSKTYRMKHII